MNWFHLSVYTLGYYIAWAACIYSAANGLFWTGPVIVLIISIIEITWEYQRGHAEGLWLFIISVTVLGFIIDTLFFQSGLIIYKTNPWPALFSPAWMIAIWFNVSLMFFACSKLYFNRYMVLSLTGLLGFPIAYSAGARLGAVDLPYGYLSTIIVGIVWAVLLPLVSYLYLKFSKNKK